MATPKFRMKIDKHWYTVVDWSPNKAEAQGIAAGKRKLGVYKSVRVIRKLMDRRYARYYVCVLS